MNKGWGRSDGEGLERIWSFLSPLVSPLRYSTKQHRLDALHLKATHRNAVTRTNAGESWLILKVEKRGATETFPVRATWIKLKETEALLSHGAATLNQLGREEPIHTRDYFAAQWERQKTCQLEAITSLTFQKLEEKLVELLDQEENLKEAQWASISFMVCKHEHIPTDSTNLQ